MTYVKFIIVNLANVAAIIFAASHSQLPSAKGKSKCSNRLWGGVDKASYQTLPYDILMYWSTLIQCVTNSTWLGVCALTLPCYTRNKFICAKTSASCTFVFIGRKYCKQVRLGIIGSRWIGYQQPMNVSMLVTFFFNFQNDTNLYFSKADESILLGCV